MMNWSPALDALDTALNQTFATFCPEKTKARQCERLQKSFSLLSRAVEQHSGDPLFAIDAADEWRITFDALREYVIRHCERPSRGEFHLLLARSKNFLTLVKEMTSLVRTLDSGIWPRLSRSWEVAFRKAERMTKEGEARFGSPGLETVSYFLSDATWENLRFLKVIKNRMRTDGTSVAPLSAPFLARTLPAAIARVRISIYVRTITNESTARRRRICRRLCKWAEGKHADIPTLTAGRSCLLELESLEEIIAILNKERKSQLPEGDEAYVFRTLALCLAEEAIEYFRSLIDSSVNLGEKKQGIQVLGVIGGSKVVDLVRQYFFDRPIHKEALNVIKQLAVPSAAVSLSDESPGAEIEEVVRMLLKDFAKLKQQSWANGDLIETIEKKVLRYHQPF